MAHAVCTGRLQVGTGGRHRQLAQAVGHIPAHGRIAPFRRVVPFRRVAQAAKQIVKARKPQSCALFSFRNQPSAPHSTFYVPKGSLSPSRFCFSVPNVQYYVHKAQSYHIQANIPSNSRTKTQILCSKRRGLASGIVKVAFLQITAHTFKMQIPHNQIINFYQRAR